MRSTLTKEKEPGCLETPRRKFGYGMDKTLGVRNGRTGSEKVRCVYRSVEHILRSEVKVASGKGKLQRTQQIFGKGARTNSSG